VTHHFVHLKCHSEYSIRDGIVRVRELVAEAANRQMPAVALTDYTNLFALVKFYKQALSHGVKPIVGAQMLLRDEKQVTQVTLLCQNNVGYKHLTELVSIAYLQGQSREGIPEITWEQLVEKSNGLIVLSGGRHGDVGQAILDKNKNRAGQLLSRWINAFGDRYYLELVRTERQDESTYLHGAVALALEYDIPVVATNDVCFFSADDFEAHEARVCVQSGYCLDDSRRPREYSEQQYFKSQEEMLELFCDIPEALENTLHIARRCNVTLDLGRVCLPDFPVPSGTTLEGYLRKESERGLDVYLKGRPSMSVNLDDYKQRLDIELDVINRMGFPGYFLIVADFIRWAKENNIPVGPGRGSGAGSLVAFCLGITMLDPLEHHLLFERFLNPERVSMPDFDVDFCMERRDEVIDYVAQRYGKAAVSQIITYGTMAAKAVIRDVGRVLGYPYGFVDKIAKLIPFELGITLDKALAQEERLAQRYRSESEVTVLIDLSKKLEGVVRNAGKHAGGVVIAPSQLTDFSALYCEPSGEHPVTQFDKDDVESVGLVKFDFLGLRTLTIIHWALTAINRRLKQEGKAELDIYQIPVHDEATFDLLKSCATTAVFQLESRGMKDLVRRLQPDSFDEITALVALFRPGPLQSGMVDDFIDRKHGRAIVEYPHPELESILDSTYGVILYQEQVMKIAQVLANYSLGAADILRRAMGKKKADEMAKQREVFREGAVDRGVDESVAMRIFDLMEKFAGYGFNKSHSAAYALLSYQTAYLKAHFPAEFMAAVLSSDMDNTDKLVGFLKECHAMKLEVIPVSVNISFTAFTVNCEQAVAYGLGAIKGVGQAASEMIAEEREQHGEYTSFYDFCVRLDMHKISRRGLEPLIKSGAMDCFGQSRAVLMASINSTVKSAEQFKINQERGQADLFAVDGGNESDHLKVDYIDVPAWDKLTRLQAEKSVLGFYQSGHPFDLYKHEFKKMHMIPIASLAKQIGRSARVAALLISVRTIVTKSGRKMAILTLEDDTSTCEVTLFNRLYQQVIDVLVVDEPLVIVGKVEKDDFSGGVRLVSDKVMTLMSVREQHVKRLLLKLPEEQRSADVVSQLSLVIKPFCGGSCPVVIGYQGDSSSVDIRLGDQWRVRPEMALVKQLQQALGSDAVILEY
jgi:DNA polymerase III subunit alpha